MRYPINYALRVMPYLILNQHRLEKELVPALQTRRFGLQALLMQKPV